jgi:hypothetical protein
MANGIYDFILACYNPKADGTFAGSDLSARLSSWPASGLTFDGADIGGIIVGNPYRKGSTGTSGEPNDNYVGNITVPMANYMVSNLHISEFKNTNIIRDGDKWDGIGGNNFTLAP